MSNSMHGTVRHLKLPYHVSNILEVRVINTSFQYLSEYSGQSFSGLVKLGIDPDHPDEAQYFW